MRRGARASRASASASPFLARRLRARRARRPCGAWSRPGASWTSLRPRGASPSARGGPRAWGARRDGRARIEIGRPKRAGRVARSRRLASPGRRAAPRAACCAAGRATTCRGRARTRSASSRSPSPPASSPSRRRAVARELERDRVSRPREARRAAAEARAPSRRLAPAECVPASSCHRFECERAAARWPSYPRRASPRRRSARLLRLASYSLRAPGASSRPAARAVDLGRSASRRRVATLAAAAAGVAPPRRRPSPLLVERAFTSRPRRRAAPPRTEATLSRRRISRRAFAATLDAPCSSGATRRGASAAISARLARAVLALPPPPSALAERRLAAVARRLAVLSDTVAARVTRLRQPSRRRRRARPPTITPTRGTARDFAPICVDDSTWGRAARAAALGARSAFAARGSLPGARAEWSRRREASRKYTRRGAASRRIAADGVDDLCRDEAAVRAPPFVLVVADERRPPSAAPSVPSAASLRVALGDAERRGGALERRAPREKSDAARRHCLGVARAAARESERLARRCRRAGSLSPWRAMGTRSPVLEPPLRRGAARALRRVGASHPRPADQRCDGDVGLLRLCPPPREPGVSSRRRGDRRARRGGSRGAVALAAFA